MEWFLGLALSLFVFYWVVRTAVHHGIRDADFQRTRAEARERAEVARAADES